MRYSTIKQSTILKLLCNIECSCSQSGASYHLLLGDKACNYLLVNRGDMGGTLTRLLGKLQLRPEDGFFATPLLNKLNKIVRTLSRTIDKRSLKQLKQMKEKISAMVADGQPMSSKVKIKTKILVKKYYIFGYYKTKSFLQFVICL